MRRTVIALSAAALAVTLSACGQGSSGSEGGNAQPEQEQSSSKPFADVAALVSGAGGSMEQKQTVKMSIKTSGGGPAAASAGSMECQLDVAKTQMACTGPTQELVTTSDAMYMKNPALAQMGGDPAKPWVKITPDGPMGQLMGGQNQSFQRMTDLESMLPPGSTITNTQQESVEGQDATRYDVVTNLAEVAKSAPPEAKSSFDMLAKAGVKEMKQTIWIGSDGLPLKVEFTVPKMTIMGNEVPSTTTTATYKEWGQPVNITVPPAGQVQDMKMPSLEIPNLPQPPN